MDSGAPTLSGAPETTRSIWPTVVGFAATRMMGNLFVRFPYVFINQISRGLGVDVATLNYVFAARELGGLAAPQAGRWVDRGHMSRVIAFGGVVAGASCLAAATSWFPLFVVMMVIGGAAKISVDLAQNAWIGHNVPLDERGRVIGIIEMTWAGAFLIGIPAIGLAVEHWGWKAAFVTTGPLLGLAAVASGARLREPDWVDIDEEEALLPAAVTVSNPTRLKRAVWIFCFLQPFAQMVVFAVNGDWFVTELNLSTGRLGAVTALLGVAELIGTIITVWVTDRFGSVRCGMWGMAIAVPPLLGIMVVGTNVVGAVGLMLVMDVAIELAFVAVLPLVSELDVNNRGKAVSHVFVLIMVARAIGSAVSGRIYETGGFNASIAVAATACAGATIALWWSHAEVIPEPVEVSV